MPKIINKYLFQSILLFFSLLTIILNFCFNIRYEENDDVVMLLISSGKYSGSIDNHLVFINFIYGSAINLFYSIIPQIEWYTISFVVLNILSISILTYLAVKSTNSQIHKLAFVLFLLSVFIFFSVGLQFTRVASILSIAGLSIIYTSRSKWFGVVIFLIGSLIRFEVGMLIMLLSIPMFYLSTRNFKNYLYNKSFVMFVLAFVFSLIFKISDSAYYSFNADWKNFKEYNQIRGKINDNPNANNINLELPSSVSSDDFRLILCAHTNLSSIGLSELKVVYKAIDEQSVFQKLNNIKYLLFSYKHYLLFLVLFFSLLLFQSKENRLRIFFIFIIFSILLIFISLNASVKPRVFFSAFFASIIFFILIAKLNHSAFFSKSVFLLLFILTIRLCCLSFIIVSNNKIEELVFNNQLKLIKNYLSYEKKIVPFGASFRIEYGNPFQHSLNFPTQKVFFSGWLTSIPFNKGKFDSFKYYIDDYGLLVDKSVYAEASSLISSSVFKNYKVKVFPQTIINNQEVEIIEFRTH